MNRFLLLICIVALSFTNSFSQSIGFSGTQATSCFSPTVCPIRIIITGDAGGAVSNTIKLTFTSTTNSSKVYIISLSGNLQDIAMNINPSNIQSSVSGAGSTTVNYVSPGTATTLPNDIYTIRASYQRVNGGLTITSPILTSRFWVTTPTPIINTPKVSSTKNLLAVNVTIPSYVRDSLPSLMAGSKKIIIADTFNNSYTLTLTDTTATNFVLDLHHINSLSTNVVSTSISSTITTDSLPDGFYKFYFSYRDGRPHSVATDSTTFKLKTFTTPPVISYPTPTTIFNSSTPFKVNYFLPDTLGSSAAISLISNSNSYNFPINAQSYTTMQWTPSTNIPDGRYSVKLSYYDIALNPPGTTSVDSILIKTKSATPNIISPIDGAVVNTIVYKDTITEVAAVADTLSISGFSTAGLYQLRKFALNANNLSNSMNYNLKTDPSDGVNTLSLTGAAVLPDGNYQLTRKHQDVFGNPYVTSNSVNITVKTATKSPLLIAPLSNSTNSNLLTIRFVLPDKALSNSAKLIFTNGTNSYQINLTPQDVSSIQSFTWDITASPVNNLISSFSSNLTNGLPSGLYDISLQYQDFVGNPVQSSIQTSVKIVAIPTSISGNLSFCKGDSVLLTSSVANTYLWSNGATSRSISVKQPGFYSVKVTYDNNQTGASDSVEIKEYPKPITPIIQADKNFNLVSSATYGNLWYLNGIFNNDTTVSIKPTQSNLYTVKTIQNGCVSAMSLGYYYLVTNLLSLSGSEFIKLSPNPFITNLNLSYNINGYQKLNMEVFDFATGMKLVSKKGLNAGMSVYLGQLPSGVYIVKLSSTDNKIVHQFKMIKQ